MLDFSDIKLGKVVEFNNNPCVITKCDFLRMQQRKPVKKCLLKNLITGAVIDYSFKSGEGVIEADLRKEKASFMYTSGDVATFMLESNYETVEFALEMLGGKEGYLKEGQEVTVMYFNDGPISVDMPVKISLKVVHTTDAAKGNSVSDITKEAELETGLVVKVPGFIKVGERVIMNTLEDEYVERDTSK